MKNIGQIITNCESSHSSVLAKDDFLAVSKKNRSAFFKKALDSGLSSDFIGECVGLTSQEVEEIAKTDS